MTVQHKGNPRILKCAICKSDICYLYLESVWELNDEDSYDLIHPICISCWQKNYQHLPSVKT